jgi:hypothetical protein
MGDGGKVDQNSSVEPTPFVHRAVQRLFPSLFALRLKREPFPWETRLGEALIYGDLVVGNPPRDTGLRQVHHVAEDVKLALRINQLVRHDGGKDTENQ